MLNFFCRQLSLIREDGEKCWKARERHRLMALVLGDLCNVLGAEIGDLVHPQIILNRLREAEFQRRPPLNHLASACEDQGNVASELSSASSDMAQLKPTLGQVGKRSYQTLGEWPVSGSFQVYGVLDAARGKTKAYAPMQEARTRVRVRRAMRSRPTNANSSPVTVGRGRRGVSAWSGPGLGINLCSERAPLDLLTCAPRKRGLPSTLVSVLP